MEVTTGHQLAWLTEQRGCGCKGQRRPSCGFESQVGPRTSSTAGRSLVLLFWELGGLWVSQGLLSSRHHVPCVSGLHLRTSCNPGTCLEEEDTLQCRKGRRIHLNPFSFFIFSQGPLCWHLCHELCRRLPIRHHSGQGECLAGGKRPTASEDPFGKSRTRRCRPRPTPRGTLGSRPRCPSAPTGW